MTSKVVVIESKKQRKLELGILEKNKRELLRAKDASTSHDLWKRNEVSICIQMLDNGRGSASRLDQMSTYAAHKPQSTPSLRSGLREAEVVLFSKDRHGRRVSDMVKSVIALLPLLTRWNLKPP